MSRIAVLCGTGMSSISNDFSPPGENTTVRIDTDWGEVPVTISSLTEGMVAVLDRHHSIGENRVPPHMIEHRANVMAVRSLKPDLVVSINSVGTMRDDLPPGKIGITSDVLDLAIKPWTFYDGEAQHFDRTSPFDSDAMSICSESLSRNQGDVPKGIIVAQCVGPQFESPAEITALERLGADTVGMTLGPESRLISETGIPHVALACSSNWAAGRDPTDPRANIDHHAVDKLASTMRGLVVSCVKSLLVDYTK